LPGKGEHFNNSNPARRRKQRAIFLVFAAIVVAAAAVVFGLGGTSLSFTSTGSRPTTTTTTTIEPAGTTTTSTSSPGWAAANPIAVENARAGTTSWEIGAQKGDTIAGFADHTSAQAGQTVRLYVSTAAAQFHVDVYRMGYYGGAGARLVASSAEVPGVQQPACPVTPGVNMVTCSAWTSSVSFTVNPSWVEGDYLFKLVADPGQSSYVPLTVTDPSDNSTYLAINSVFTWQAWNPYGGYDMFGGPAAGNLNDRAKVASYDRPYDYAFSGGDGSGDFLSIEYPFVRFAEQLGLNISYATDIDVTTDPGQLLRHKVVVSLGHNEFWSAAERQAVINARDHGVNLMFLGATPGLRPARLQDSPLGANREMVAYRDPVADPIYQSDPQLATANTWNQSPLDAPPSEIVGNTYGGYGIDDPMVITNPTAWPFTGTGVTLGTQLPHVISGDYDHYLAGQPGPSDVEILAQSPVVTDYGHHDYSDMIYYSEPGGAGVFSTGSIGWTPSLSPCAAADPSCPAKIVRAITSNVLRLFGQGPAGRTQPSVPNTSSYQLTSA
jgi:hypothetical protein